MKRSLTLFLLYAALSPITYAQWRPMGSGARAAALAYTGVARQDLWAAYNNQAGLAGLEQTELGISLSNPYWLEDILQAQFAFLWTADWGNVGLSASYRGFQLYNQKQIGLNYSRKLGKRLAAGVQLNIQQHFIAEGEAVKALLIPEGGLLCEPLPGWQIGFHLYNPTNTQPPTPYLRNAAYLIKLGMAYDISPALCLSGEVRKAGGSKESYATGIEYAFSDKLQLRTGLAFAPLINTLGLGYRYKKLFCDLAWEYGQRLGNQAVFSIQYRWP